ncbi:chromate transporter [Alteribacillus bidgolensis]|uniref:Chromate transporter n=1 Tax=Alteribacillus bidgolensis TaxID=930129 RepID=A0A1G8QEG3_9BACI|nr:chromate transporter [Alteribacillus bidgolensis]SDJ03097.1 chromate transporter [Alteribacillus bidgolensis]
MIYWEIFMAFFIPGIVGYGGGPASIPLIEHEVVNRYEMVSVEQFGEILALGNTLPGPIATKMAGYIGYETAGLPGAAIAIFATVAPSLIAMILLLGILIKFKDSPRVKQMTIFIRPAIAVLLGVLAYQFFNNGLAEAGVFHTVILGGGSFLLFEKSKIHPAIVILLALVYGVIFLS